MASRTLALETGLPRSSNTLPEIRAPVDPGRSSSSVSARRDDPGSPATIGSGLSPTEATVLMLDDAPGRTPPVWEQPATVLRRVRRQSFELVMRMSRNPPPGLD